MGDTCGDGIIRVVTRDAVERKGVGAQLRVDDTACDTRRRTVLCAKAPTGRQSARSTRTHDLTHPLDGAVSGTVDREYRRDHGAGHTSTEATEDGEPRGAIPAIPATKVFFAPSTGTRVVALKRRATGCGESDGTPPPTPASGPAPELP